MSAERHCDGAVSHALCRGRRHERAYPKYASSHMHAMYRQNVDLPTSSMPTDMMMATPPAAPMGAGCQAVRRGHYQFDDLF